MFVNLGCAVKERTRNISLRNNTSGNHGIRKDKNSWRAKCKDNEGKEHSKSFSIARHGDDEAKTLAIEWRKARELEFGYYRTDDLYLYIIFRLLM